MSYLVRVVSPSGRTTYLMADNWETPSSDNAHRYPSRSLAEYAAHNHRVRFSFKIYTEVISAGDENEERP